MRAFVPAVFLFSLLFFVSSSEAQWKGEERDVDGVPHVLNPDAPISAPETIELTEMWRLGGYSDAPEEFFGVISDIEADSDNNFYVLDAQLSEVRIFDQSGNYVTTIGREGEGPGEFRRPQDLNVMPDGTIGIVQPRPSKMILLTKTGDPAGEYNITPRGEGFPGMSSAQTVDGNIALVYAMGNPDREKQRFTRTVRLSVFDAEGNEINEVASHVSSSSFTDTNYAEKDWTNFERAWSATSEGTIAVRTSLTDYEVAIFNADGTPRHVVRRAHDAMQRSDERIERIKSRWAAMMGRWVQNPTFDILPDETPVQDVHAREDGTVWVRTARGTWEREANELATFDVFDVAGRYERRLTMNGDFDPTNDGIFVTGSYLLVVTDLISAAQASMGGAGDDEGGDADPMEIICYRMQLGDVPVADRGK